MQDRKQLVRQIARMWQTHYRQEALYKSLLRLDISQGLKGLCANGHISSLISRHELNRIYESFKCSFSDSDLWSISRSEDYCNLDVSSQTILMIRLFEGQNELIGFYKTVLHMLLENEESFRLCADHLEKLKDLNQRLSGEYQRLQYFQHQFNAMRA